MSATLVERPTFSSIIDNFGEISFCTECRSYDMGCDQTICRGLDCD